MSIFNKSSSDPLGSVMRSNHLGYTRTKCSII
jgi:hypothetical protein